MTRVERIMREVWQCQPDEDLQEAIFLFPIERISKVSQLVAERFAEWLRTSGYRIDYKHWVKRNSEPIRGRHIVSYDYKTESELFEIWNNQEEEKGGE